MDLCFQPLSAQFKPGIFNRIKNFLLLCFCVCARTHESTLKYFFYCCVGLFCSCSSELLVPAGVLLQSPVLPPQKKAKGEELFEQIMYHLDIVEKDYFGLRFMDYAQVPVSRPDRGGSVPEPDLLVLWGHVEHGPPGSFIRLCGVSLTGSTDLNVFLASGGGGGVRNVGESRGGEGAVSSCYQTGSL